MKWPGLEIKVYSYENVEKVDGKCYMFCTEPCFCTCFFINCSIYAQRDKKKSKAVSEYLFP